MRGKGVATQISGTHETGERGDRLVRFGFEWFSKFCTDHSVEVLVINDERLSPEQEVVQDLISIIHVFSCKVYGLRKYSQQIASENK